MAMHQLIEGYKAQGWGVHLLAMNTRRHSVEEDDLRAAYSSIDGVNITPFDNRLRPAEMMRNFLFSRKPEHADRFYDAAFEKVLVETVERVQPDVVQMESLFLTGYLPAVRAVSDAALVLRMHNVERQIWHRAARETTGAKRFYLHTLARRMARYEQWAWNQYHLLLPITPDDAEAVREADCDTPRHLTPFGIHIGRSSKESAQALPDGPRKFYHLGAMDWLPNREGVAWFLREAWPRIVAVHPAIEFHFAGRLLESGFAAPLPEHVFNHGQVEDAAGFAAGMDALIVPLRAGGGIRVKILEAMAAGKPVLSTSVGIQGIAAKPGEHFLQADTPQEFSEAVQWMVSQPDDLRRIALSAQAMVKTLYDAEKIAASLSERLLRLLQEGC